MTTNSSLYDGIHSLLLIWVALRNLGDTFLFDSHVSDFNAVPTPGSKQLRKLPLGSSMVQWSGYILARSSCQCTPNCRIKNRWLRSCIESSSTSLLDRSHGSKEWGFFKFNADDLEHLAVMKWLIPNGCGVKHSPVMIPWANGGPQTAEGFHCAVLHHTKPYSVTNMSICLREPNGLQDGLHQVETDPGPCCFLVLFWSCLPNHCRHLRMLLGMFILRLCWGHSVLIKEHKSSPCS